MADERYCPGCHHRLDVVSASGRADDLYLCSRCYHSWFAFELQSDHEPWASDDPDDERAPVPR